MLKKTILITGSTDGIGKIAALKMANQGHHVYLHGRNSDKLQKTKVDIIAESSNENVKGFVADFSDMEDVRKMAKDIQDKEIVLDVLINNAGVFKSLNPINNDGFDIRIVVNYFAPFLLTHSILKTIKKSPQPMIINLSSAAQSTVSLDFLEGKIKLSDQDAYAQSKLAILMWSFYLSKQEPDICVIALNPGSLLNTKMVKEAYGKFWSSADKGADIIYDLATSDHYYQNSGEYFDNDRGNFGAAHPNAYEDELVNNLMNKTKSILE